NRLELDKTLTNKRKSKAFASLILNLGGHRESATLVDLVSCYALTTISLPRPPLRPFRTLNFNSHYTPLKFGALHKFRIVAGLLFYSFNLASQAFGSIPMDHSK
ncbi:MAG: hypothetical protein ACI83D_000627, partial [Planctomycetota bacterium]